MISSEDGYRLTPSSNLRADCADGTCYEGACAGDSVSTTDGQCGRDHGYKQCAGVRGDCCNAAGKGGTGPSFCGYGVCQLGNCSISATGPISTSSKTSSSSTTKVTTTSGPITTTTPKPSTSTSTIHDQTNNHQRP